MYENGGHDRYDSQPVATCPVVALFKEIRQSCDIGANVKWSKEQRQRHKCECSHPLEVTIGKTVDIAFLSEAHQMNSRYVRGEQRKAYNRPCKRFVGEKYCAPPSPLPRRRPAQTPSATIPMRYIIIMAKSTGCMARCAPCIDASFPSPITVCVYFIALYRLIISKHMPSQSAMQEIMSVL